MLGNESKNIFFSILSEVNKNKSNVFNKTKTNKNNDWKLETKKDTWSIKYIINNVNEIYRTQSISYLLYGIYVLKVLIILNRIFELFNLEIIFHKSQNVWQIITIN